MQKDLPHCITVTQGTHARAVVYRTVCREFEEAFRSPVMEANPGHFEELELLFLPKTRNIILYAAKKAGLPADLPTSEEIVRCIVRDDDEAEKLKDQIQEILGMPVACSFAQHAQWILNGRRVYDLSPALFCNLLQTDFSRLMGEDIPVPLDSFYVHLSDAPVLGEIVEAVAREEDRTWKYVFTGAYVRWAKNSQKKPYLDILAIAVNPDKEIDEMQAVMAVPLYGNVEEVLQAQQATAKSPKAVKVSDPLIRLVIGLCFYLSCDDADVERKHFGPSPEVKARAKKLGGTAGKKLLAINTLPVHYLRVGHRHETRSVELESLAGADKETRKLLKRHVVRGHFRQQPCGPGRKERKTVFVRSFWKGPPWAEAVGSIHKIRERTAS